LPRLLAFHRNHRNQKALPPLTEEAILFWADAHCQRTGDWPTADSGPIPDEPGETWAGVCGVLQQGCRGLPGGSSLARLLAEHRNARNQRALPPLTEEAILFWADAYYQRTGDWPTADSGPIPDERGETWTGVDMALSRGNRGLPGGSSLARLLTERRGRRHPHQLPDLSVTQILAWADAFYEQHRTWPAYRSGSIPEAPEETWQAVQQALVKGTRGMPGGCSLAKLLGLKRGRRCRSALPKLTVAQILAWADQHRKQTGEWPKVQSGAIHAAPGENWSAVNACLRVGNRGLPGRSSLAHELALGRGVVYQQDREPLTVEHILGWADAYHARTGAWPNVSSGLVEGTAGERWKSLDSCLRQGLRGLPQGLSLARVLVEHRGGTGAQEQPARAEPHVLAWADAQRPDPKAPSPATASRPPRPIPRLSPHLAAMRPNSLPPRPSIPGSDGHEPAQPS
jgi:hypothetical protein